jgi:hypothetical protein
MRRNPITLVTASQFSDTPTAIRETATGRATCRICGEKISRGSRSILGYISLTDGGTYNPWTAVDAHVHEACLLRAGYYLSRDSVLSASEEKDGRIIADRIWELYKETGNSSYHDMWIEAVDHYRLPGMAE